MFCALLGNRSPIFIQNLPENPRFVHKFYVSGTSYFLDQFEDTNLTSWNPFDIRPLTFWCKNSTFFFNHFGQHLITSTQQRNASMIFKVEFAAFLYIVRNPPSRCYWRALLKFHLSLAPVSKNKRILDFLHCGWKRSFRPDVDVAALTTSWK